MRSRRVVLLLAGLALSALVSGCVPMLEPMISKDESVFDAALVGTWVQGEGEGAWSRVATAEEATGSEHWTIEKDGDREYVATLDEGAGPQAFSMRVVRYSSGTFIQLRPRRQGDTGFTGMFRVPCYMVFRLALDGTSAHVYPLDAGWLKEKLAARSFRLDHVEMDDTLVLTAKPKALRRFIERHGQEAFHPPVPSKVL